VRALVIGRGKRREAERLRHVVDCLPYETRLAMLEGLRRYDRIIVGAYSDRSGGVCPMLAAHRCGGRTDFRAFARAWDRFTGAKRRARRASEREVRTLTAQIEASVWREDELRAEMTKLSPSVSDPAPQMPAERNLPEGAWLMPFRRWDGYRDAVEAALRQLRRRGAERSDDRDADRELVER
jgi:hypothetical protein